MSDKLNERGRRVLAGVLNGFDSGPIELTHADVLAVEQSRNDPALVTLLDQLKADIERRDGLIPEYEKAKAISSRAESRTHGLWSDIRSLNSRAAKTREAIELLRGRVLA